VILLSRVTRYAHRLWKQRILRPASSRGRPTPPLGLGGSRTDSFEWIERASARLMFPLAATSNRAMCAHKIRWLATRNFPSCRNFGFFLYLLLSFVQNKTTVRQDKKMRDGGGNRLQFVNRIGRPGNYERALPLWTRLVTMSDASSVVRVAALTLEASLNQFLRIRATRESHVSAILPRTSLSASATGISCHRF